VACMGLSTEGFALRASAGVESALKGQLKTAQGQLRMHSRNNSRRCAGISVGLAARNFSRADEYFKSLKWAVNERVREMVEKKPKEARAEITRLEEAMQVDGREREARIKQTQQQLARWDNIGKYAKQVVEQIETLKRPRKPVKP
jgi:DNA transposition AAA+ family ATPase